METMWMGEGFDGMMDFLCYRASCLIFFSNRYRYRNRNRKYQYDVIPANAGHAVKL